MKVIKVNALGDTCPIPIIKAKDAVKQLGGAGAVEIFVDNEIAVQNLAKLAEQKGYAYASKKLEEQKYSVVMTVGEGDASAADFVIKDSQKEEQAACSDTVVVISSDTMGSGDDTLGRILMKGFIFALTQLEEQADTVIFFNGGARLTCEGSDSLEDITALKENGVQVLTCGTCLNHYGLTEKLAVGDVTNMYVIAQKLMQAGRIVRP